MTGERRVLLGKIVGVFGVRGFVKLQSHTEPRDALFDYLPWTLCSPRGVETQIDELPEGRPQGRGLVALLPGVATREQAETLVGSEIWVERTALPKPKRGEYYWIDLEGCSVRTVEGVALGTLSHLFNTGANDVMSVKDGAKERLIPFLHDDVVKSVDLDAKAIVVDWDPDF
jgi:16S rRNA processing protein RimM